MSKPKRDVVIYRIKYQQYNTEPRTIIGYERQEVTQVHYDNIMSSGRADYITERDYQQLVDDGFVASVDISETPVTSAAKKTSKRKSK